MRANCCQRPPTAECRPYHTTLVVWTKVNRWAELWSGTTCRIQITTTSQSWGGLKNSILQYTYFTFACVFFRVPTDENKPVSLLLNLKWRNTCQLCTAEKWIISLLEDWSIHLITRKSCSCWELSHHVQWEENFRSHSHKLNFMHT